MLMPARMAVVTASAAARIEAPIGPVHTDLKDVDELRASSLRLKRMGFCGRQVERGDGRAPVPVSRAAGLPLPDGVRAPSVLALAPGRLGRLSRHDGGAELALYEIR